MSQITTMHFLEVEEIMNTHESMFLKKGTEKLKKTIINEKNDSKLCVLVQFFTSL